MSETLNIFGEPVELRKFSKASIIARICYTSTMMDGADDTTSISLLTPREYHH